MAQRSEAQELFVTEMKEMLWIERQLSDQILPELTKEVHNPELRNGLERHLEQTKQHAVNIERAFELLGEDPKTEKSKALDGLSDQHDKTIKKLDSAELKDLFDANAAAKTEHMEIAAYNGLIGMSEAMGQSEITQLLRSNLEQEEQALREVEQACRQLTQQAIGTAV